MQVVPIFNRDPRCQTDKYEPNRGAQHGGPSSEADDDDERSQSGSTRYLLLPAQPPGIDC